MAEQPEVELHHLGTDQESHLVGSFRQRPLQGVQLPNLEDIDVAGGPADLARYGGFRAQIAP
jgi:hypothetical protein